jgi:hypothetical protein
VVNFESYGRRFATAILAGEIITLEDFKPLTLRKGNTLVMNPVSFSLSDDPDRRHYPLVGNVWLFHMKRFFRSSTKLPKAEQRPRHSLRYKEACGVEHSSSIVNRSLRELNRYRPKGSVLSMESVVQENCRPRFLSVR